MSSSHNSTQSHTPDTHSTETHDAMHVNGHVNSNGDVLQVDTLGLEVTLENETNADESNALENDAAQNTPETTETPENTTETPEKVNNPDPSTTHRSYPQAPIISSPRRSKMPQKRKPSKQTLAHQKRMKVRQEKIRELIRTEGVMTSPPRPSRSPMRASLESRPGVAILAPQRSKSISPTKKRAVPLLSDAADLATRAASPSQLPPELLSKYKMRKERLRTLPKPVTGNHTAAMADISHHYMLNSSSGQSIFAVSVPIISYKGQRFRSRELEFTKTVAWARATEIAGDGQSKEEERQNALNMLKECDDDLERRARQSMEAVEIAPLTARRAIPKVARKYEKVTARYMLESTANGPSSAKDRPRPSYDLSFDPQAVPRVPKTSTSKKYSGVKSRYQQEKPKLDLKELSKDLFKPTINDSSKTTKSKVFDYLNTPRISSSDTVRPQTSSTAPLTAHKSKSFNAAAEQPRPTTAAPKITKSKSTKPLKNKAPPAVRAKTALAKFTEENATSVDVKSRSPIPKKQPKLFTDDEVPDTTTVPSPEGKTRRPKSPPATLAMVRLDVPSDNQPSHPSPIDTYRAHPNQMDSPSTGHDEPPVLNQRAQQIEEATNEDAVTEGDVKESATEEPSQESVVHEEAIESGETYAKEVSQQEDSTPAQEVSEQEEAQEKPTASKDPISETQSQIDYYAKMLEGLKAT